MDVSCLVASADASGAFRQTVTLPSYSCKFSKECCGRDLLILKVFQVYVSILKNSKIELLYLNRIHEISNKLNIKMAF